MPDNNQPPLVKGGQGRSSESLISCADWLIILFLAIGLWLVFTAIGYGIYQLFV